MVHENRPLDVISETDLALIHALQIAPRAPWNLIGSVVGLDAATAARHWAQLTKENLAWFTVRASAQLLTPTTDAAVVRVQISPDLALDFATHMGAHADVIAVDLVSGSHQVMIVIVGHGIEAVRARVATLFANQPAVQASRYEFLALVHREDSQWRLRVLSESQKRQLHQTQQASERAVDPQLVHSLVDALQDDARLSFAALAERLNVSEATARRSLSRALRTDGIHLGCDVATQTVGLGRAVILEVSVDNLRESARVIASRHSVVRCAEFVASGNLLIMLRLATLAQLAEFESEIQQHVPGWDVRDRQTVTRAVKRQGRLLDSSGRASPLS